ncbi:hypothetical protein ZIOFF_006440 [Zingiber officinale]|uniref:Uncharacterized protein n=1 Tax=Zingiber officinale TaxID=94328 RepID=A0A8J5ICM2_ZINOF|nr:hypothetical protein ZIOFF_006440 [Zingiber officinale]
MSIFISNSYSTVLPLYLFSAAKLAEGDGVAAVGILCFAVYNLRWITTSSYGGCWLRNSYDGHCARVVEEGKAFRFTGKPPAALRLTSEPLTACLLASEPFAVRLLASTRLGLEVSREGGSSEIDEGDMKSLGALGGRTGFKIVKERLPLELLH